MKENQSTTPRLEDTTDPQLTEGKPPEEPEETAEEMEELLEQKTIATETGKAETPLSVRLLAVLGIIVVLTFFGLMLYSMVDTSNETASSLMLFLLIPVLGLFFFLRSRKDR